jgi:hypothetical protein
MPTTKRVDGDYSIYTTVDGANVYTGNINMTTDTVKINGNLDVGGNVTYINVTELNIRDPFILLNSSNTGTYSSNSGILTHTSNTTFAGLRYDNSIGYWQTSNSTGNSGNTGSWFTITTGGPIGGANTQIQFNDDGQFGATANLTFDKATNNFSLQGQMVWGNLAASPTAVSNSVVMYHSTVGEGDTGMYVKDANTDQELITKRKAVFYSLIL